MSAARIERLLNLLALLLNSRRPISLREIREHPEFDAYCNTDPKSGERAFERDKAALLEMGVPLKWVPPESEYDEDGSGGYLIERDKYYLSPLNLSDRQRALLGVAASAAAQLDEFPDRPAISRALTKLAFDSDYDAAMSAPIVVRPFVESNPSGLRTAKALEVVQRALSNRKAVRVRYRSMGPASEPNKSATTTSSTRIVEPYGIYFRRGHWYLVGYCRLRQGIRTFHLGRITSCEIANTKKTADYTIPDDFQISRYSKQRPWQYSENANATFQVKLVVSNALAGNIDAIFGNDVNRTPTQSGITIEFEAHQLGPLAATLVPYMYAIEILAPQALRTEVVSALQGVLTLHDKQQDKQQKEQTESSRAHDAPNAQGTPS